MLYCSPVPLNCLHDHTFEQLRKGEPRRRMDSQCYTCLGCFFPLRNLVDVSEHQREYRGKLEKFRLLERARPGPRAKIGPVVDLNHRVVDMVPGHRLLNLLVASAPRHADQ